MFSDFLLRNSIRESFIQTAASIGAIVQILSDRQILSTDEFEQLRDQFVTELDRQVKEKIEEDRDG